MSRMTTRTKIGACVGLLVLSAGVVWVSSFTAKPAAEVSFVRYADAAKAVVQLNNQSGSEIFYFVPGGVRVLGGSLVPTEENVSVLPGGTGCIVKLSARNACQIEVLASESASDLIVRWGRGPSRVRQRLEALLGKDGINIASTGFVATVDLPAR